MGDQPGELVMNNHVAFVKKIFVYREVCLVMPLVLGQIFGFQLLK